MSRILLAVLVLVLLPISVGAQSANTTITLDASAQEFQINKDIYGHFAEHIGRLGVCPSNSLPH